jgi:acetoin utilization deacetylase AcuC-like enzyme
MAGTPPGLSPDTFVNASTSLAARLAAGASADVASAVARGLARSGLAVVRPPGHHAESNTAQGFCLFNNAALACRAAQRAGARRVLCFDWDVHHGNGTQAILEEDADVCYVSVHRHDGGHFYPGTGAATERGRGVGLGATLNVPWPRGGMGDADYLAALAHVVLPCAYEFNPDVVVVSAGFDACAGDPIGGCDVSAAAFAHMLHALTAVAPTVLLLEGGYNLDATARAVEACARVALGERPPRLRGGAAEERGLGGRGASPRLAPQPVAMLTLHEVAVANAGHWACLRGLAGEQPFAPSAAPFSRFGGGGGVFEEEGGGGGVGVGRGEDSDSSDGDSDDDDGIEDLRPQRVEGGGRAGGEGPRRRRLMPARRGEGGGGAPAVPAAAALPTLAGNPSGRKSGSDCGSGDERRRRSAQGRGERGRRREREGPRRRRRRPRRRRAERRKVGGRGEDGPGVAQRRGQGVLLLLLLLELKQELLLSTPALPALPDQVLLLAALRPQVLDPVVVIRVAVRRV